VDGLSADVQVLHGAVGHQEPILAVQVLGLASSMLDELL